MRAALSACTAKIKRSAIARSHSTLSVSARYVALCLVELSQADHGADRIMARILSVFGSCALLLASLQADAASEWTGPPVNFAKGAFADHTLPANQDRLTANVWITRAASRGLFNIAQESFYDTLPPVDSPAGTRWARGSLASGVGNLTYQTWETTVRSIAPGAGPPDAVNVPMVMHLLAEDIYLDITMASWAPLSGGGGAFGYTRSSPAPVAVATEKVPFMPAPVLLLCAIVLSAIAHRHRRE